MADKGDDKPSRGAGLLVGLLEDEPKDKPSKAEGEEPSEESRELRLDALRALKEALDGNDLEAADDALQDYLAAQE